MTYQDYKTFEEYRADLCAKALTLIEARQYKSKLYFFVEILGYSVFEAPAAIKECKQSLNRLITDGWPIRDIRTVGRYIS